METFEYRPIEAPDQIRILELLPGEAEEPISVRILHAPITEISNCEALSYEWGSPTQDVHIFCEGKTLKVTPNLVAALKRLRERGPVVKDQPQEGPQYKFMPKDKIPKLRRRHKRISKVSSSRRRSRKRQAGRKSDRLKSTARPHLLWIDAICIDQNHFQERSRQVTLMGTIYSNAGQVTVWVGEELPQTREACYLLWPLSYSISDQDLDIGPYPEDFQNKLKILELADGTSLKDLSQHIIWPIVMDLFASRSVFQRLWIVQEIVLAPESRITILCGSVPIRWSFFCRAASLILCCSFLRKITTPQRLILISIVVRCKIQRSHRYGVLSLWFAIYFTLTYKVKDDKDRVFALLGLLPEIIRARFDNLSYQNSGRDFSCRYGESSPGRHVFELHGLEEFDPRWG